MFAGVGTTVHLILTIYIVSNTDLLLSISQENRTVLYSQTALVYGNEPVVVKLSIAAGVTHAAAIARWPSICTKLRQL